ncbi:MAG TPA: FmdB family zinc ribbon protein [Ktedonobacterales bacterium]|nr:FmdB family zinc ribbon protein [Ktedonobacterales bacterium]
MPAYDYKCQSCGNRFEVWQKITDDPIQVCPRCSGHVQRVIHATGIVFKGSGFYSTDHRAAGASEAVASAPAAESAGETKPAANGAPSERKVEAPAAKNSDTASATNPPTVSPTTASAGAS